MRLVRGIALPLLALTAAVSAATSWTFDDATLNVLGKGAGVGGAKEKCAFTAFLDDDNAKRSLQAVGGLFIEESVLRTFRFGGTQDHVDGEGGQDSCETASGLFDLQ